MLVGSVLIVFMNKFEQWHMVESGYFDLFGDFLRLNLTIGNSFLNFIGGVFTLAAAVCGMAYVSSLARVAESNDEDFLQNQHYKISFGYPGYFLIVASGLLMLQSFLFWIAGMIYKFDCETQFSSKETKNPFVHVSEIVSGFFK